MHTYICDCLSKNLHSLHQNWVQFYCHSLATDTVNVYSSPVLNVNWSAFLKVILPTLQSHDWNNGTNGGHKLVSGNLGLLWLTLWPAGVSSATVFQMGVFATSYPTHPTPSHCTLPPISPTPLYAILTLEKDSKK